MTLYYLHTASDRLPVPDRCAFDAADGRGAVRTAVATLLDIAHDGADVPGRRVQVSVRDRAGEVVFQAELFTLGDIERQPAPEAVGAPSPAQSS